MTKSVTPQEMFDLWQKMVNPGGYPLQSLMFPVLDPKEIEKKISELEVVEHWLKANLNMLQLSIKSLEYQKAMLKGGERVKAGMEGAMNKGEGGEMPNPALRAVGVEHDGAGEQGRDGAGEQERRGGRQSGGLEVQEEDWIAQKTSVDRWLLLNAAPRPCRCPGELIEATDDELSASAGHCNKCYRASTTS